MTPGLRLPASRIITHSKFKRGQDFEAYGSLPYYLDRSVGVVDSRSSDLWWGQQRLPQHPNLLTVAQALASPEGTLLVVRKDRQEDFVASGLSAKASALTTIGNATLYRLGASPPNSD